MAQVWKACFGNQIKKKYQILRFSFVWLLFCLEYNGKGFDVSQLPKYTLGLETMMERKLKFIKLVGDERELTYEKMNEILGRNQIYWSISVGFIWSL